MSRTLSIVEAAREITASSAPLLLLDTCALVDVIRAPSRSNNNCIGSAMELAEKVDATPKRLHLVVAPVIPDEWKEHSTGEKMKLEIHIRRSDESVTALRNACDIAGIRAVAPAAKYSLLGLPDLLCGIAARLYDAAIALDLDDSCRTRAATRAVRNLPPSRKGKGIEDCDIVEHYLALCRELKSLAYAEKVVFVSSNTDDFCERDGIIHTYLLNEFSCVAFTFATNLAWAQSELGL